MNVEGETKPQSRSIAYKVHAKVSTQLHERAQYIHATDKMPGEQPDSPRFSILEVGE